MGTKSTNPISRFPREKGLTQMSQFYQENPNPNVLKTLQDYIVKLYIFNSFSLCKTPYSIPDMAQFLQIPIPTLHLKLQSSLNTLPNLLNQESLESSIQSLISLSIQFSLEDRSKILDQYQSLKASQGSEYKPFISSEVNKALKLLLESNKSFQESLNPLIPKQGNNTLILNQSPSQTQEQIYNTTEETLKLIQAQPSFLPLKSNETILHQLEQSIPDIPIDARISTANTDNSIEDSDQAKDSGTNTDPDSGTPQGPDGNRDLGFLPGPGSHSPIATSIAQQAIQPQGLKAKRKSQKAHETRRQVQYGIDPENDTE